MKISKKEFENIASLAALSFDESSSSILKDLERIISRFESLKKINTDNVVPTAHVTNLENSLREDIANKVLSHEEILSNAPQINSGQIKIPRVFENE
tara:strand:- start:5416 stop:5706 length:291 start_codon:yes stop_codon:yes gene_type:complete